MEKEEEELTCEDCGVKSADVKKRLDPFLDEIYYLESEIIVCHSCYMRQAEEI